MERDDRELRHPLVRRRLLRALGSLGAVGLAGCSGGDSGTPKAGGSSTATETSAPTDTPPQTEERDNETAARTEEPVDVETPEPIEIVVAQDGSGDHQTVQAAVDAAPGSTATEARILIQPGRYKEKLTVPESRPNTTFVGVGDGEVVLTYDDDNEAVGGTSASATVTVEADDFTAWDVTFENTFGRGSQAVALNTDADHAVYANCRFLGHQDTLLADGAGKRQYFSDCRIEGTTDFIFGGATALFENCEVVCLEGASHVTAASTPPSADYGYVFESCEVVGPGAGDDSCDLGRPWKSGANVVYLRSFLGDQIRPAGWQNWNGRGDSAFYAEYDNDGPGYVPEQRVDWAYQLTDAEAAEYTRSNVFGDWNPEVSFVYSGQLVFDGGESVAVSVKIWNPSTSTLEGVDLTLDPPNGDWSVAAANETSFDAIEPGGSNTLTWQVTPPESARGEYDLTVSGGRDALTTTKPVLVVDTSGDTAPIPYALNNGGERAVQIDGLTYEPLTNPDDRKYVTDPSGLGSWALRGADIANTNHDELYWTENSGEDMSFSVTVPNGTYDVTLHFAEIYHSKPGQRIFDVSIQGETVFEKLDLVERVGPKTALTTTVSNVEVTDESLDVSTTTHKDNSKLSGIAIREA